MCVCVCNACMHAGRQAGRQGWMDEWMDGWMDVVYIYMHVCIYTHEFMPTYMYVCMCACMHVCLYIYTHVCGRDAQAGEAFKSVPRCWLTLPHGLHTSGSRDVLSTWTPNVCRTIALKGFWPFVHLLLGVWYRSQR